MIYPDNFETKIGFDKIRQLLYDNCLSPMGREMVNDISFEN
jgi:DNA mismatch repair protein MutS2